MPPTQSWSAPTESANRPWRKTLPIRPSSAVTPHCLPPQVNCWATLPHSIAIQHCDGGCATMSTRHSWSSTRSDISPTLTAMPICCSSSSRRYEHKSTLVTTNRPFAEWREVFPTAACVASLIDRLVHHAEIIAIDGESYRLKEATERSEKRGRQRRGAKP